MWTLLAILSLILFALVLNKLALGALVGMLLLLLGVVNKDLYVSDVLGVQTISSLVIFFELMLLLWGALAFYRFLDNKSHFQFLEQLQDDSEQGNLFLLLIFAMFLGSFFEGVAGFGVPAMLIAPLLLKAGFKPPRAIVLSLVGNCIAVNFGALGTPFRIGLGQTDSDYIGWKIVLLNTNSILVLPFLLTFLAYGWSMGRVLMVKYWKLLLGASICFWFPFVLGVFLSAEMPALLAGAAGLLIFVTLFGSIRFDNPVQFWWRAFRPYVLLVVLLLISRFVLSPVNIRFSEDIRSLSLHQPGFVFFCVIFLLNTNDMKRQWSLIHMSFSKIKASLVTIGCLVLFAGMLKAPIVAHASSLLSHFSEQSVGYAAAVAGIMGAFVTGSATLSNLLWAPVGWSFIGASELLWLAMLGSGSAIGNMISLQNILMVQSIVPGKSSIATVLGGTLPSTILLFVLLMVSASLCFA